MVLMRDRSLQTSPAAGYGFKHLSRTLAAYRGRKTVVRRLPPPVLPSDPCERSPGHTQSGWRTPRGQARGVPQQQQEPPRQAESRQAPGARRPWVGVSAGVTSLCGSGPGRTASRHRGPGPVPHRSQEPGSPVADRATRSCFHAVTSGSINAHCSSDKSVAHGIRSTPATHHVHDMMRA
jgi:hypothetical protein